MTDLAFVRPGALMDWVLVSQTCNLYQLEIGVGKYYGRVFAIHLEGEYSIHIRSLHTWINIFPNSSYSRSMFHVLLLAAQRV